MNKANMIYKTSNGVDNGILNCTMHKPFRVRGIDKETKDTDMGQDNIIQIIRYRLHYWP